MPSFARLFIGLILGSSIALLIYSKDLAADFAQSEVGSWLLERGDIDARKKGIYCTAGVLTDNHVMLFSVEPKYAAIAVVSKNPEIWKFRNRRSSSTFLIDGRHKYFFDRTDYSKGRLDLTMSISNFQTVTKLFSVNGKKLTVIDDKDRRLVTFPISGIDQAMQFLNQCLR